MLNVFIFVKVNFVTTYPEKAVIFFTSSYQLTVVTLSFYFLSGVVELVRNMIVQVHDHCTFAATIKGASLYVYFGHNVMSKIKVYGCTFSFCQFK